MRDLKLNASGARLLPHCRRLASGAGRLPHGNNNLIRVVHFRGGAQGWGSIVDCHSLSSPYPCGFRLAARSSASAASAAAKRDSASSGRPARR
jgi:hypothetical protein